MPAKPKLFLIDGHALCYRSFYAIRELSNSKGQPTNAVFGFTNTLKKIIKDYEPHYVAVCFDTPKRTRRQEKYAEYKIQRPSMPEDLISQIPIIKEVIEALNLPVLEKDGYEADDVIATVAQMMAGKGIEVVIVTDDKDMYQLMDAGAKIYSIRKGEILGPKEAKTKFGFDPKHIVDFIGLAGDSSDNIPGVSGVGAVSAQKLINEFGSLESILKSADKIKSPKLREKLLDQRDEAIFSKELALLETDIPLELRLEDMKVGEPARGKLFQLFKDLEFKRLADEYSDGAATETKNAAVKTLAQNDLKAFAGKLKTAGQCSFSIDSGEESDMFFSLYVSLKGDVYQVSGDHIDSLKDVFADQRIRKIGYDLKECMKLFSRYGCELKGELFDVMLAGFLLGHGRFDISSLAWDYLQKSLSSESSSAIYAAMVEELYKPLVKELKDKKLLDLFTDIEMPLAYVLYCMETEGVNLDLKMLQKLSTDCTKKIQVLEKELYKLAGEEFNPNSPKQLSVILFEKLKLPVIKKTKTGFSTNEEVLVRLSDQHELPTKVLEYRQLAKLRSTYIDALPKLVDPKTKRIHTSFNQTGAETGRLSSNNPNLQNIPIRTELGREIRRAFIPSQKGNRIISADYSQVELRILAHLSGDENLKKAFEKGQDIHNYTSALIFEVKEKDVTADMRDMAKRVNFGIAYGMSAFGLSKDLKIPMNEAQEFIDRYFLRYPKVKEFMDQAVRDCRKNGYVTTLLQRRRYIPEITSKNVGLRQFAERQAINTPVQGSAADLLKLAMINIHRALEKKKMESQLIITVHDELVFDAPKTEEKEMIGLIREKMEHPLELTVPIKISIKAGDNWLETKGV